MSDDERTQDLAEVARAMPMGALIVWFSSPESTTGDGPLPRQPSALLKIPVRRGNWKGAPMGYGRMELHTLIPEGPLIRFVFQVFDKGAQGAPLTCDAFLNPADDDARAMLDALTRMEHFYFHAYGEGGQYLGTKQVTWHAEMRRGARELLDRTEGMPVLWPDAMDRYRQENPL